MSGNETTHGILVNAPRRRALVTGASRGIGRAIAMRLREAGVDVLTPTRLEMDLANPASIATYLQTLGPNTIDILVNNAGINFPAPFNQLSPDALRQTLQINLEAPLQLIQALAPAMRQQRWGRIVNISSIFSMLAREGRAAYAASKSGLNGLGRTLAVELAADQVLLNTVCPGYVETDLTRANNPPEALAEIMRAIPLQRLAQPDDIAEVVAFLCSEKNRYMTGQTITVDGGFSIV